MRCQAKMTIVPNWGRKWQIIGQIQTRCAWIQSSARRPRPSDQPECRGWPDRAAKGSDHHKSSKASSGLVSSTANMIPAGAVAVGIKVKRAVDPVVDDKVVGVEGGRRRRGRSCHSAGRWRPAAGRRRCPSRSVSTPCVKSAMRSRLVELLGTDVNMKASTSAPPTR